MSSHWYKIWNMTRTPIIQNSQQVTTALSHLYHILKKQDQSFTPDWKKSRYLKCRVSQIHKDEFLELLKLKNIFKIRVQVLTCTTNVFTTKQHSLHTHFEQFQDSDFTSSLGSLFLCLTTLPVKKIFQTSNLNLHLCNLSLFPLVLSHEEVPTWLQLPSRHL